MFPQGEAEENIEVKGKQNSLFPVGPVIKCFVMLVLSNLKLEKSAKKFFALLQLNTKNCRGLEERVKRSCCCFSRDFVSVVCTKELVSFDPRHVTCSPPIGKCRGGPRIFFRWGCTPKEMAYLTSDRT